MGSPSGDAAAKGRTVLSIPEAFCAIASQAVYVDGSVAREEQDALVTHLEGLQPPLVGRSAEIRELLARVNKMARAMGQDHLLRAAADALPAPRRGAAYRMAHVLVHSDLHKAPEEGDYLEQVRAMLGLTTEEATAAVAHPGP